MASISGSGRKCAHTFPVQEGMDLQDWRKEISEYFLQITRILTVERNYSPSPCDSEARLSVTRVMMPRAARP